MELIARDEKCLFCKAACLLAKDQDYLREIGFTHDPDNCRDCDCLPEHIEARNAKARGQAPTG